MLTAAIASHWLPATSLEQVFNSIHPTLNYSFSWKSHLFLCLLQTSGFGTQPKSRDVRGDIRRDGMMGTQGFTRADFSPAVMGSWNNPEKPDKKRPISGDQQIQFGTKHNFHGLKSAT